MRKIIYAAAFAICTYFICPNNTGKITQEPTFWNNHTIYFNYEQKNDQNNTEIYQIVMKKENGEYIIRVKKQEKTKDGKTIWRTVKYGDNETFSVTTNNKTTQEIKKGIQKKINNFEETDILKKCQELLQRENYQEFINTITENKDNIKGIDISHYNKINDDKFKKRIKENKIRYIYIKATEGDDEEKTSICTKQIKKIKEITKGYPCALGAYFLFHHKRFNGTKIDETTTKEIIEPQLDKAIKQYQLLKENNPFNICPFLDFEFDEYNALPQDGAQKEKAKQNKKNAILYFINLFQKRTGTKIGIFCSYTTYLTFFKDDKNFKNIPLWISHDQKQGDIKSYRKTYQIKPTMLQHSQRTPCTPGSGGTAEGRIDVNTTNIQNLQELLN